MDPSAGARRRPAYRAILSSSSKQYFQLPDYLNSVFPAGAPPNHDRAGPNNRSPHLKLQDQAKDRSQVQNRLGQEIPLEREKGVIKQGCIVHNMHNMHKG